MSLQENGKGRNERDRFAEPTLDQALTNFRQSVHAWSEAVYDRPRIVAPLAVHRGWRLAVGWALGCVLAAGSLTGGLYQYHRQAIAKGKADQAAKQRQVIVQQRASNTDEDLLADVDNDVSRAVPAAMEPLAQLMDSDGDQ